MYIFQWYLTQKILPDLHVVYEITERFLIRLYSSAQRQSINTKIDNMQYNWRDLDQQQNVFVVFQCRIEVLSTRKLLRGERWKAKKDAR